MKTDYFTEISAREHTFRLNNNLFSINECNKFLRFLNLLKSANLSRKENRRLCLSSLNS